MRTFPLFVLCAGLLGAQEVAVEIDPAQTHVSFTLGATLHTVHGTFRLTRGAIRLDPATGKASGELIVNGASGESGNDSRDRKMHQQVLESARYPEISFLPDRVEGPMSLAGPFHVQLHGTLVIHGAKHEMTVPVEGQFTGNQLTATTKFEVPYIAWGMKNPSTFVLRVSDKADVEIRMVGQVAPAQ